jgi:hypothetical protein
VLTVLTGLTGTTETMVLTGLAELTGLTVLTGLAELTGLTVPTELAGLTELRVAPVAASMMVNVAHVAPVGSTVSWARASWPLSHA